MISWKCNDRFLSVRKVEIAELKPKKVSQGTTSNDNEAKFGAANSVDKDLRSQSVAPASWLKIEFGKTSYIHKVIIYYRFYTYWYGKGSGCALSVPNFKACVDRDNNVDVSVYQGDVKQKSCGTLKLTYGLEQSDQIYTLICNTEGDTVKLSKTTGNIAVFEIVITGPGKI
jgi:hypothetical protein